MKTTSKRYSQQLRCICNVGLLTLAMLSFGSLSSAQTATHRTQQTGNLFGPAPANLHRLQTGQTSRTKLLTKEQQEKYEGTVQQTMDVEKTLDLVVGHPQLLIFKRPPVRIQIPNDDVATITTISEKELSVMSHNVGTTVLNVWFENEENPYEYEILSYLIRSIPDPETKARVQNIYTQLESELNSLFPESNIQLLVVGDKLVVKGKAANIVEAAQILKIIQSQASTPDGADIPMGDTLAVDLNNPDIADLPQIRNFLISGSSNVINMLEVPGENQIMLRVTVAEINRSAARSIGFNFEFTDNEGDFTVANLTGDLLAGGGNVPFTYVSEYGFQAALRALRGLNFAKSLAEPTLVTLNGKEASFQTGGSFPVPVVTGATSDGLQGVVFQDFGVNLSFTPYTLTNDKVRLIIEGEVSSRNDAGGGQIQNTQIPGLDQRNFNTTVELREGQTLAIAGILQTETRTQSEGLPFLGDLPLIGPFFGSRGTTTSEQELLVLVTPEIVEPLEYDEVPNLPGFDSFEPDDLEFYLYGRMESRADVDFRSPVQNDFDRLRWHRLEQTFMKGPSGYASSDENVNF